MKKTILLAGIIASMTTMANVTGFVEGNAKGDVTFAKEGKETKVTGNIEDLSVKGEVKVNKLTLGAILKNKDIKEISKVKPLTTEMYTENLLDNSSVYAKYELPEFAGIKSYVKGTLNPKAKYEADGTLNFKKGNVELEGQLAHSFSNGAEVSLTSKTTFPFEKKDGEYGKAASSEHTLKLGAKKLNNFEDLEASLTIGHVYAKDGFRKAELNTKGTYVGLKDTKLNGEFNFIDEKEDDGKTDKNMAVSLKAGANYKGVKDLELDGKFNFKYQVKGTSKVKDIITDSDIVLNKDAYAHSYELDAKYTGVKDLELTAGAFVQHIHFDEGEYANYSANGLNDFYSQSLLNDTKDISKEFVDELNNIKDKYNKAKEDLEKITEAQKETYNNAKSIYDDALNAYSTELDKEEKTINEKFGKINPLDKAKADTIVQKTKEIFDKLEKLDSIRKKISSLDVTSKHKYANKEYITSEKEKLINEYNTLGLSIGNAVNAINKNKGSKDEKVDLINKKDLKTIVNYMNTLVNNAVKTATTSTKDGSYTNRALANVGIQRKKASKVTDFENNEIRFNKDPNTGKLVYNESGTLNSKVLRENLLKTDYLKAQNALKQYKKALDFKELHKTFVENAKEFGKAKLDLVNFGAKLGAKYTGVKNLTLTADGLFAGRYHSGYDQILKYPSYTTGYVKLHAGAKYDFKLLNDKLVVSPEGNVTATFDNIYAGLCEPSLVLAPKVSVSYKPVDALKVAGSVEVPVKFGLNDLKEFSYQSTGIKGSLNMRYEWK